MRYEYCEGWHRYYREPIEPIPPEQASRRATNGERHCILAKRDDDSLVAFIDVNDRYFSVNFLDDERRVFLTYGFEQVNSERLFLKQSFYFEFDSGSAEPFKKTAYYFDVSGTVTIERSEAPFASAVTEERKCDLSCNWELAPRFGQYENLLQIERSIIK